MAEDQTKDETQQETSSETAGKETQQTTEPDYKTKFTESQKEAIRLAKENKELKAKLEPKEKTETEEKGETLAEIVEKKVRETIAPITKEQQEARVDQWIANNPDVSDHLAQVVENYDKMPGKNIEEKLENAFLIAKKNSAKEAGKKEMAFAFYQKGQAATGGGGASGSQSESLPDLTAEERKVARALGVKDEDYAKNKILK